jgi:hypothetical protein
LLHHYGKAAIIKHQTNIYDFSVVTSACRDPPYSPNQFDVWMVLFRHTQVKSVTVLESTGYIATSERVNNTACIEGLERASY